MRLQIRHETVYGYETRVAYSVQRLFLTPPSFSGQAILQWKITAPGIENALNYRDGFGNSVHLVTFQDMDGPVSIIAEGLADVADTAGVVKDLRCAAPDAVFLRQTGATRPSEAISHMAAGAHGSGDTVLDKLHGLMNAIKGAVAYRIGATDALTTAAQAYAAGRGVCQDHAHIFIGAARQWGIPARYVTGYLALEDEAVATASHAWAEALVPDLGWVGFDPANGACPTDRYVRVAGGIDANGVTPIRGSRKGGSAEQMRVAVNVGVAQQ
jgi:transglutaminase-like putative cysteine protease